MKSYQPAVQMQSEWYGQTQLICRILQLDGLTWNGDGVLEVLAKGQTPHGLVVVRTPWQDFKKIPNAWEAAGDAWNDAEEDYRRMVYTDRLSYILIPDSICPSRPGQTSLGRARQDDS